MHEHKSVLIFITVINAFTTRPWWSSGLEPYSQIQVESHSKMRGSNPAWGCLMEKILNKKELWSRSYIYGTVICTYAS